METLIGRWRDAAVGAGATADEGRLVAGGEELLARWAQPHRQYHTVEHLIDMLSVVDMMAGWSEAPDLVRLATWCHDAVYDPRSTGDANERASADLAGELLGRLGVPAGAVAEVRRLVLLTAGHHADPQDRAGSLICDADLAILGTPPERYDRYAAAIRREYRHVPVDAYRAGRATVLRHLLDLPARYRLPALAERWEGPARTNLTRELSSLTSQGPELTNQGPSLR